MLLPCPSYKANGRREALSFHEKLLTIDWLAVLLISGKSAQRTTIRTWKHLSPNFRLTIDSLSFLPPNAKRARILQRAEITAS